MVPYTYKLIFKPTGQYYYGVRYSKDCHPEELFVKYFTSSKHIHKLIKEYGVDTFTYKVSKIFKTPKEAIDHEHKLLCRVNADKNGKFINKTKNKAIKSNKGLIVIHHILLDIETWHDPNLPIPEGWVRGASSKRKRNLSISLSKKYNSGYTPHNKGKKLKPTGPCSNNRRKNISESRKKTKKITCNFCNRSFDPGNYKKFHGDNCKLNPNIDVEVLNKRSQVSKKSYLTQLKNGNFNQVKPINGEFKCEYCGKKTNNLGGLANHKRYCQNNLNK